MFWPIIDGAPNLKWVQVFSAGGDYAPPNLRGQTAVIVGTGGIGSTVAYCLQLLGAKTIGYAAAPAQYFDVTLPLPGLDGVLPNANWLVLARPLTTETSGLIDARRFALLPQGAGFVNVSRGEIVAEPVLIDALRSGRLRGAYLDVFAVEPLPAGSLLWDLPNVIISPPNAAASDGYIARGMESFLRNLGLSCGKNNGE